MSVSVGGGCCVCDQDQIVIINMVAACDAARNLINKFVSPGNEDNAPYRFAGFSEWPSHDGDNIRYSFSRKDEYTMHLF